MRVLPMRRLLLVLLVVITLASGLSGLGAPGAAAPARPRATTTGLTIVTVKPGADPAKVARRLGVKPVYIYRNVLNGFAAEFPAGALSAAHRDSQVKKLNPDRPVRLAAQTTPDGITRINAPNQWAGPGAEIDAGVAVLDTGIARKQAKKGKGNKQSRDLNVVDGKSCIKRDTPFKDEHGHGTHVAGTVAARDNGYGVVGVAPGARLYAVKVLSDRGGGSDATIICGLDWVAGHANEIDVINLSLGGPDIYGDNSCAQARANGGDPLYAALCDTVDLGISVVVAAGNEGIDAEDVSPARYDIAIAVSAFADTDGAPGGNGDACRNIADDEYAGFSTYGSVVDIAAPGACVRSTKATGGTVAYSGTSMAAPHVAGALALFYAENPTASVATARNWLLNDAAVPQNSANGLEGATPSNEPVLHLPD